MAPLKAIVDDILREQLDSSYFSPGCQKERPARKLLPRHNDMYICLSPFPIMIGLWVIVLAHFSLTALLPLELFAVIMVVTLIVVVRVTMSRPQH